MGLIDAIKEFIRDVRMSPQTTVYETDALGNVTKIKDLPDVHHREGVKDMFLPSRR